MKKVVRFFFGVLLAVMYISVGSNSTFAYTDNIGILHEDINEVNAVDYLNKNNFHCYKGALYVNHDESVMLVWNEQKNSISGGYIVKPGYATDKGIEVGMSAEKLKQVYGNFYTYDEARAKGKRVWDDEDTGWKMGTMSSIKKDGYYEVEYIDRPAPERGEMYNAISFIINAKTNKITCICMTSYINVGARGTMLSRLLKKDSIIKLPRVK